MNISLTDEDRDRFEWWRLNHVEDTNVGDLFATLIVEVKKLEFRINHLELPPQKHACSTGDCDHSKRHQCKEELEKFYGPDWTPP